VENQHLSEIIYCQSDCRKKYVKTKSVVKEWYPVRYFIYQDFSMDVLKRLRDAVI
jgi:hypothetical protein